VPKATPTKATGKKAAKPGKPAAPAAPAPTAAPPRPPVAKGRLGAEMLPPPAAAPSRDPVSIVVARSEIVDGGARIKAQSPPVVRVARGQVVHVKHAYRLQEASLDKEEYRFLLKSRLAGREHPPSLARLGDQWGVPEDVSGYLQHEYTMSATGTHRLEFEAGAEYCVMGWKDTTVKALDRKDLSGAVDIVVG